jgi:hypothetical protein
MVNGTCNRRRQNKANLPARPQTGVGQGSQQRSRRSGVLRQTNPICGSRAGKTIAKAGGLDAATHGANVRNEANLPGYAARDEARGTGDERQMRKTNPILPVSRHPEANRAKRSQFLDFGLRIADWGQTCGATADCAKRTQFQTMPGGRGLGAIMRNEANSEQVGRGRPTHEETIMQNKAKPGQARVSGGWRWGSSLRKTCETKPICGGVSSVKTGKAVVGASNFTHYTSNSAEGRSCKTKPIARSGAPRRCPPRAGAMDVESAPVCRSHPNPHNATAALALPV